VEIYSNRISGKGAEPPAFSWRAKFIAWWRLQKLEREIRRSRRFQKFCEKHGCMNLAEMEKSYREKMIQETGALSRGEL
jgi:hypothetical protein